MKAVVDFALQCIDLSTDDTNQCPALSAVNKLLQFQLLTWQKVCESRYQDEGKTFVN